MRAHIYLFPGQGSQTPGMGADLFARFPELVEIADEELGYSIEDLCVHDSGSRLNQTQFTQPALYVVNALMFLSHLSSTRQMPSYVAGHSLGEYSALFAAGVFDFRTGLRLVIERARLMGQATGGGMAAVIGLRPSQIRSALTKGGLDAVDVANFNSPLQTVISGLEEDLDRCEPLMESAGAQLYARLPVSAAFHSRYMEPAATEYRRFLERHALEAPRIPVLSNVTAEPHVQHEISVRLSQQISRPVRWANCIRWLLDRDKAEFLEIGPSNILTGLLRRNKMESNFQAPSSPRPI